ncbi:MAG: Ni/Fe hydrogenase subunit alpha [archaeon]
MATDYISKIEGHGRIEVDFLKGKAELHIEEGERLFEGIVVGRRYEDVHFITPRICGVCPTAHNLATIRAIEDAFKIRATPTAVALRKAMLSAQIVQSHTLHLFFLALPDFLGVDSGADLMKKNPKLLKKILAVKKMCDAVLRGIGGREVHPTTTIVGGFTQFPEFHRAEELIDLARETIPIAEELMEVAKKAIGDFAPVHRKTTYLALEDYYGDSFVETSERARFDPKKYQENISETVKLYSSAKFGTHKGRGFLVGALARRILAGKMQPTTSIFDNNIAQGEEIFEFTEEIEKQLALAVSTGLRKDDWSVPVEPRESFGVGAVEAPRGTLYNKLWFDSGGICTKADIVTPTAQNLTNIEDDANALLEQNRGRKTEADLKRLLEMLVRAYDPCITCSVH